MMQEEYVTMNESCEENYEHIRTGGKRITPHFNSLTIKTVLSQLILTITPL